MCCFNNDLTMSLTGLGCLAGWLAGQLGAGWPNKSIFRYTWHQFEVLDLGTQAGFQSKIKHVLAFQLAPLQVLAGSRCSISAFYFAEL